MFDRELRRPSDENHNGRLAIIGITREERIPEPQESGYFCQYFSAKSIRAQQFLSTSRIRTTDFVA